MITEQEALKQLGNGRLFLSLPDLAADLNQWVTYALEAIERGDVAAAKACLAVIRAYAAGTVNSTSPDPTEKTK